jgi:hypothetical protein
MSFKRKGMSLPSVSAMRKQWTMLRLRIRGRAAQNGNVRSDAPDRVGRGDFFCMPYREGLQVGEYQSPSSLPLGSGLGVSKREAADARA